jgi:hypothetical protein
MAGAHHVLELEAGRGGRAAERILLEEIRLAGLVVLAVASLFCCAARP